MENFKKAILNGLSNTTGKDFVIVIDGKVLKIEDEKGIKHLVKVRHEGMEKGIFLGYRTKVDLMYMEDSTSSGKTSVQFIEDSERVLALIADTINNPYMCGFDFTGIVLKGYGVDIDTTYKVISLVTRRGKMYLEICNTKSKAISTPKQDGTQFIMRPKDIVKFRLDYAKILYNNYRELYIDIISNKLTSSVYDMISVSKFFKLNGVFVNVFVNGGFVVNPLTSIDSLRDRFKKTDFYKMINRETPIRSGKLQLYYLTNAEICEVLHVTDDMGRLIFMKFNNTFVMPLVFNDFILDLADNREGGKPYFVPNRKYRDRCPYPVVSEEKMREIVQYYNENGNTEPYGNIRLDNMLKLNSLAYLCYQYDTPKIKWNAMYTILKNYHVEGGFDDE